MKTSSYLLNRAIPQAKRAGISLALWWTATAFTCGAMAATEPQSPSATALPGNRHPLRMATTAWAAPAFSLLPTARADVSGRAAIELSSLIDLTARPLAEPTADTAPYLRGADRWRREMPALLRQTLATGRADLRSPSGFTALQAACLYGQPALLQTLLAHGADPQARPHDWQNMGRMGDTPLGLLLGNAAIPEWQQVKLARLLLEAGADPDAPMITAWRYDGQTLIERKTPFSNLPTGHSVRLLLLQYGEQDMEKRMKKDLPFDITRECACLRKLLEGGLDPNKQGEKGSTLLWKAILDGDLASVRVLLEHGADPNARSRYLAPPLFWLLRYNRDNGTIQNALEMARLLLDHGADIDALDNEGRSLLRYYRRHHDPGIERLLDFFRQRGAVLDPDAPGTRKREGSSSRTDRADRSDACGERR